MSRLLPLLVLALIASVHLQSAVMDSFARSFIRLCLRPEFVLSPSGTVAGSKISCARACGASPRCRAFRLTPDSTAQCQTFEFDRCSHRANLDNCSQFGWAYVRRIEGLPDGRLCPDGYVAPHFTSNYKLFSAISWSAGLSICERESGLTKFADGNDLAEVDHLHWIKRNLNSGRSYFVGGHRTGNFDNGTWFWHHCNASFLPEVWLPGQPNEGDWFNLTNIWKKHITGIDDVNNTFPGIGDSLCECINPFE